MDSVIFRSKSFKYPHKDYDKYYIDRKIIQVVKKVGEGENDFIIVTKALDSKIDIKEFVNASADSCGVYNILKKVIATGDTSYLNPISEDSFTDISNIPSTTSGVEAMQAKALKSYNESVAGKAGLKGNDAIKMTSKDIENLVIKIMNENKIKEVNDNDKK